MQIQILIPNKDLGFGFKGLAFAEIMNMDKGLIVAEWVLINRLKIPKMTKNVSANIVCPSPNFGISMKKGW